MTRLSDALKRAAEIDTMTPPSRPEAIAVDWDFAATDAVEPAAPAPTPAAGTGPTGWSDEPTQFRNAPGPAERQPGPRHVALRVGDADRDKLVINADLDPALIEQYRHLAAVLHHSQEKSGTRSVMVTSAVPNEGKTLTATNLALTLSQSYQRRVLLIDGDLRRPRLREMFALPEGDGLVNILGTRGGGGLPLHHVSDTLSVLTAGRIVADPMSMLVSPAMKQLLDEARDKFDWVVVDTPPIAILPDANLLSAMIDTALLVVSAQSTPYPLVQRAAQAIGPGRILGVVLNRAEHAAVPVYHYGYPGDALAQRQRQPRRWWRWLRKSQHVPSGTSPSAPTAERTLG